MNYLFSRLSGFSVDTLRHLPKNATQKIELLSFWTFLGVFFSCLSVAYIIQISTKVWVLSMLSFFFIFFVLYLIQSLLLTTSFIEIETLPGNVYKWQPTKVRVIIFSFIGILFSQPVVFLYKSVFFNSTTNVSVEKLDNLKKNVVDRIGLYKADKELSILQRRNFIALINGEQNGAAVSNNAKKALIVFNEGSIATQNAFEKELQSIGFSVQNLKAVNSDNFNLSLTQYSRSIRPGDVSFIFFVGKYKEKQSKFFLLPSDSNTKIEDAVDLQAYVSQFNKSKPLASLFVFNLIDDDSSNFFLAANKLKAPFDSIILVKHGSLKSKELDNFIKSVLEKLSGTETIKSSFWGFVRDHANKSINDPSLKLIDNLQQTIYLNNSKKVKVLSDQEILDMMPVKGYCSKFANAGKKYVIACLTSQIDVLQDGINYLDRVKNNELEKIEKLKEYKSKNPSMLVNFFQTIESNLFASFFYTLVAIFLISGGFLLRDLGKDSIDVYERFNFKRNRINVLVEFRRFRINAKRMRLGFMGVYEKVSIADFPNPFSISKSDKIIINKAPSASGDFFDSLQMKLRSDKEKA